MNDRGNKIGTVDAARQQRGYSPAEGSPGRDGKAKAWTVLQEAAARTWMYGRAVGGEAGSPEAPSTTHTALLEMPEEADPQHSPHSVLPSAAESWQETRSTKEQKGDKTLKRRRM